jgi:hypothetical protein
MDKLIEAEAKCAHKRVVHRPMPIEGGLWADRWYCDLCRCEFTPLAAVRAHDAGTDEEVISYRARQIWRRFVGIPITEPYTAEFQWLLDLLSGNEAPKKTLTEAVQAARGNLEPPTVPIRFDSPASHAAESAPQLDAEDQHRAAEPVEDAVERIVCHACGMAMVFRRVDTKTLETFHTCAEARKGYVKLEDVEKVIREFESKYDISRWTPDYLITELRAHLAPKPEPSQSAVIDTLRSEDFQRANACIECGTLVVHQELHAKWHAALVDRRTK